jgi:type IV secretory pathway VirB2 component (pilin)
MKDEVLALIRELATMLEPGATAVWEIVLRQQMVMGILGTIGGALALAVVIAIFVQGWRAMRRNEDASFPLYVIAFCLGVFAVPWFVTSVMRLTNPAYYAIMALKGML